MTDTTPSLLERAGIPSSIEQGMEQGIQRSQQAGEQARTNIGGIQQQQRQALQDLDSVPHTPPPQTEAVPNAPQQQTSDPLRAFGQVLPTLAMLGGLFVQHNATAALKAGASAMNAVRQNDHEALQQAHQEWTDRLQAIRARNEDVLQRWQAVANDEHMSREEKLSHFTALGAMINSEALNAQLASGELGPLMQYGQMFESAHAQLVSQMQAQERINMQRESMNALTPDTINYAAQQYRTTGVMPAVGSGAAGAAARGRILARAAELARESGNTGESDRINQAGFRASQGAMVQLQRQHTMSQAFERTALANLRIAEEYSGRVDRGGIPVLNRWINAGRNEVAGDPDVAAFHVAVQTFVNEYAKIMSGSTGAAGATEGARSEAQSLLNTAQTPAQFREVVSVMRRDMENRMQGFQQQQADLRQSMQSTSASIGAPQIPPAAIQYLQEHPDTAPQFASHYGVTTDEAREYMGEGDAEQ